MWATGRLEDIRGERQTAARLPNNYPATHSRSDSRDEALPAMPPWSNFYFWSPPEDAERPTLPYASAFTVCITEHVPPRPFGLPPSVYPCVEPPYDTSDKHLKTLTQTRLIVTCPPIEANHDADGPVSTKPAKATLKADGPIAVKDGRGPQLVLCTITPKDKHSNPFQAVAKIFDPLYYSFQNNDAPHRPVATTLKADSDYSIEAAAYALLQKTGQTGAFAPEYYGSWTFTLPIRHRGIQHERHVRLVLVEYIDGVCMRDLYCRQSAPLGFTEEHRLDVLADILDGAAKMDHSGVNQRDLRPCNIMLQLRPEAKDQLEEEEEEEEGRPRVVQRAVLVDYSSAVVYHLAAEDWEHREATELPPNPMDLSWNMSLEDFGSWVPKRWQCNRRAQQEWLEERFGGQNAYAPVSRVSPRTTWTPLEELARFIPRGRKPAPDVPPPAPGEPIEIKWKFLEVSPDSEEL